VRGPGRRRPPCLWLHAGAHRWS